MFQVELLRLQDHPLSQKPPIIADSLKSLCGKTASKDDPDSNKYVYVCVFFCWKLALCVSY